MVPKIQSFLEKIIKKMCKKSYLFHIFIVFNIFWLKVNRLKAKKKCAIPG